jgi:hypothetical protein
MRNEDSVTDEMVPVRWYAVLTTGSTLRLQGVCSTAWAAKLRDRRNIGDFRQWRKPAEYQKSLERLVRDLKGRVRR